MCILPNGSTTNKITMFVLNFALLANFVFTRFAFFRGAQFDHKTNAFMQNAQNLR